MNDLKLVLKGFCMGIADVIPGISGGTMAFILGIYEELISSIKSFDLRFVQLLIRCQFKQAFAGVAWRFLGTVFCGIIAAILIFSKIISWLLVNQPVLVYSFFFGLILATVPMIARIIKQWTPLKVMAIVMAALAMYFFVGLVPLATPEAAWFVFLSGAIAISAMILPGISGAFILVLLGKYQFILDAVNQRDFFILGVFVCGVIVGIVSFVRILSWLFGRYHDMTVAILTGIVIGSLRKIWPWKQGEINIWPAQFSGEILLAFVIMAFGFILALVMNSAGDNKLVGESHV